MNSFKYLGIHCTSSPYDVEITADDIFKWHLGLKHCKDGRLIYRGKYVEKSELLGLNLDLPSGDKIEVLNSKGRGWTQVGYSDLIQRSGKLVNLVPYNFDNIIDSREITNGAPGYNSVSRHVALAGGWTLNQIKNGINPQTNDYFLPEELFTTSQLETLLKYICVQLQISSKIIIVGHNQLTNKRTCPNFDVRKFLQSNKFLT
jgi:N-acetylmuramoyl-L-alanine amidase.